MEPELAQPIALADDDVDQKFPEQVLKSNVRNAISAQAGDTESLLGTTADATQLLLYGFATLIVKLHTANSLAGVREAAAPFADLSAGFLAKVEAGEARLPFMDKGLETVVSEIEQRATAVAEVLQSAQGDNKNA
jgi:hypothetical protein